MNSIPTSTRIAGLVAPYIHVSEDDPLVSKLSLYLDLLLRWNARTNLTAIRDPEEIVARHFGEGLFAAAALGQHLAPSATLLDFGSGAGFPGLPIQLYLPNLRITLAESQNKKAAFLREAVRTLALPTEVWSDRVESMPATSLFDCITLRAVDRMDHAIAVAIPHLAPTGILALLTGEDPPGLETFFPAAILPMPRSDRTKLLLYRKIA